MVLILLYIPPSNFDSLLGIYNFELVVGRFGGREKGKKETFVLFIPCGTPRKTFFPELQHDVEDADERRQAVRQDGRQTGWLSGT